MKPKIHAGHVEVAVANLIGWRRETIVPNVSWGLGLRHECDMLCLDQKQRFTEIEIKVSRSDLKKDFEKSHGHKSKIISRLIYAVSHDVLELALEIVPMGCGIIVVELRPHSLRPKARWVRQCRHTKCEKPDAETINKFYSLGCMRIWSLKEHLNKIKTS